MPQIIFLYRYQVLQQAELGLYRRLHGKVKCDCRDRLSSIKKKRDTDCFSGV